MEIIMKSLISALGAILFSAVIVGLIVLWLGVGSGLIDPHRLLTGVSGKVVRHYPDGLVK
jgi:hypothetical protein